MFLQGGGLLRAHGLDHQQRAEGSPADGLAVVVAAVVVVVVVVVIMFIIIISIMQY